MSGTTGEDTSWRGHAYACFINNLLVFLTVLGVVIGAVIGLLVRQADPSQDVIIWIGLPGEMYMRMLKMMILPLIICSVITGSASLDPKCNGRISIISFIYMLATNSLSCIVPLVIALTVKPGEGVSLSEDGQQHRKLDVAIETQDIFVDLIRNLFPDNIVTACFLKAQTNYRTEDVTVSLNETTGVGENMTWQVMNKTILKTIKGVGKANSTNVLGIVICCVIFGMATSSLDAKGKPFLAFFSSANEVIMKVLRWFVWFTPIGVASLIAVALLETEDLVSAGRSLGMFSLTVLMSLAIHQFLILPIIHLIMVRENPYSFLMKLGRPFVVSFATASSAVAIPETLTALEAGCKIDKRITRFVVPFGTTINRDGSCIFIAISCAFIAQLTGSDLHAGRVVLIWILTTMISLAIPSVPSAGIVSIIINLTALGIRVDLVGLLFATEWILDRFRTGTNMISHAFCTKLTYHYCKTYLPPVEPINDEIVVEAADPMVKH